MTLRAFDWDDDLLNATREDGQPRARVCLPSQIAIVLGRGSRPEQEVHVEVARSDGIPILRRRGGGCSVVLDPGNVIVSCTLPLPGLGGTTKAFRTISKWVIDALDQTGLHDVHQAGTSDLALGEQKIGGACIYRTKDLLYYSTTLLFQPDLGLVDRYLKHPPREPEYRAGRKHSAFMGSLAGSMPPQDIGSFAFRVNEILTNTVETLFDANFSLDSQNNHRGFKREVMV